jgi:catechol 2,3-dioxygenase-like lactoylglutathione lyase family enzyme
MAGGVFPGDGVELSTMLVVGDLDRSVAFYRDVLGASLVREYGGTSAVFQFQGSWLLLVTGGGPTSDKPSVSFVPPSDPSQATHELTIRVPDCDLAYDILRARGAEFLTPPALSSGGVEKRCFFRDPDGRLLEISELL